MRTSRILPVLGLVVVLAAGCGQASSSDGSETRLQGPTHTMADGTTMSDSEMAMPQSQEGPSEAAAMICAEETRDAVKRAFALDRAPRSTDAWKAGLYRCDYELPGGTLHLSVQDASDPTSGAAYFQQTRSAEAKARPIPGMLNFGLPGYETPSGEVVFLKDGKTLKVDPSDLDTSRLTGDDAGDASYAVAAAVVACWSE